MTVKTLHLTEAAVIEHLTALTVETPDRRASCTNFKPTDDQTGWQPVCIAGHVYAREGLTPTLPPAEMKRIRSGFWGPDGESVSGEYTLANVIENGMVASLVRAGALTFESHRAAQLLSLAQGYQDNGAPWREAVAHAFSDLNISLPAPFFAAA